MNTLRRWIAYDTFKLIVTLLLLALLLILLLQKPALSQPTSAGPANQALAGEALQQPSTTPTAVLPTPTLTPQPTSTPVEPTPTTPPPTPTATLAAPSPTPTPETPAPTAVPQAQPASVNCPLAAPSRLALGNQALVTSNLNLRKDAGMDKPILLVSLPGSKVDVTAGPLCVPYQNGAYLWWNVKTQNGATGWSAEASLSKNFYFLEPVK